MRRIWICVLAALLTLCCLLAAASAEGTAVIDANTSTKLHLRAGASTQSKSKGLYFTGTQVICETDTSGAWIGVRIGAETGYMKAEYLRLGDAGKSVVSEQPIGTVKAPKGWVNFRAEPSANAERVGKLTDGQRVTVLGETASHWVYAEADGALGYVKATYVALDEAGGGSVGMTPESASWKTAYAAAIRNENEEGSRFCLIDVNGDDVPELVIHTGFEAGGCRILTYSGGKIDTLQTDRLYFTYQPGRNLLCNSDGNMGYYHDYIYEIRGGKWQSVGRGDYNEIADEAQDASGRYICKNYAWNGVNMTREAYMAALDAVYDESRAVEPTGYVDWNTMMDTLKR